MNYNFKFNEDIIDYAIELYKNLKIINILYDYRNVFI